MATLTDREIELFRTSEAVRGQIDSLARTAEKYARELKTLIGKRVTNSRGTYEITYVSGYLGKITGRGRKILKNGKPGLNTWDLGMVTEHQFNGS